MGWRAHFFGMMYTLLGAAVSDGLENGQVVSGVGGQYNFVAMAQEILKITIQSELTELACKMELIRLAFSLFG